jgi:predicted ArsR family transcriptional regulator
MSDFDQNVTGIGALADPVRRQLYKYVCEQREAVGRDEAAAALDLPRHKVKFHLDRLEADGLLTADYVRLSGRTGPGAGRPAKVYRRADREIAVSLPQRGYELAGRIMADAIAESMQTRIPITDALRRTATAHGHEIAAAPEVAQEPEDVQEPHDVLGLAMDLLAEHGYEPRRDGDRVVMMNCPFHSLANTHTQLVCEMNHALITGITDTLAPDRICACLEPAANRCCVVLTAAQEQAQDQAQERQSGRGA